MSRPLRIEYEGAWYHVMNRGTNRCKIFSDYESYQLFLKLFAEITDMFGVEIHAYCLMENHYHLLLRTPIGNLSRIMRHLDGVYTQRFNRLVRRDGPLFRGRYKALLVETDPYLLQVSRYIHLNPVAKNNSIKIEDYVWSSYLAYLNSEECPKWLHTAEILGQINGREAYQRYMFCGIDKQTAEIYGKKFYPAILGSEGFKQRCLEKLNDQKTRESQLDIKRCKNIPTIANVISRIAVYFNVQNKEIVCSKRGIENLPRILSMLVCRCAYGYKISEIAADLSGITPAAVSSIIGRYIKRLSTDSKFLELYYRILDVVK